MSPSAYRKITGTALGLLIMIVITGSAVRLTESGLGCSDWPTCEQDQFVADLEMHAMIEFVNRMITGLVSAVVIVAALGAFYRRPKQPELFKLALGLVAGVLGQIILGGLVVLSHLNPWLVLGHFLLSMVLVANAVVLHARAEPGWRPSDQTGRWYRWPITGLASLAIVIGTFVTGAGPHSGSYDDELIERLPLAVRTVTRFHATTVIALIALVVITLVQLSRRQAPQAEMWRVRLLLTVLLAQAAIGYVQYFTGVPVILVGFHIVGACAVWIATLWFHMNRSPEPVEVGVGDGATDDSASILVP